MGAAEEAINPEEGPDSVDADSYVPGAWAAPSGQEVGSPTDTTGQDGTSYVLPFGADADPFVPGAWAEPTHPALEPTPSSGEESPSADQSEA
eukprot:3146588-Alexandrium_andersonii.AAC.1